MANYHSAFAGGGKLAEWPMPLFPLRDVLLEEPLQISDGQLQLSRRPGLGVRLTPQIERDYAFVPEAIYACSRVEDFVPSEAVWVS